MALITKSSEKFYHKIIDKYMHAEPVTGRIAREIANKIGIAFNLVLRIDDLKKE